MVHIYLFTDSLPNMYNMGSAKVDRWMVERTVHNSEYLNFRRAGNPGMRNSRSRPFPGMKPLIPTPELWEWILSFPSRSRNMGVDFFYSLLVPKFWEWSFSIPFLPKVLEWNYPFLFPFPNSQKTFLLTPVETKPITRGQLLGYP